MPAAATRLRTPVGEAKLLTLPMDPSGATDTTYTRRSCVQATIPLPSEPRATAGGLETARSRTVGVENEPPAMRWATEIAPCMLRWTFAVALL